MIEFKAECGHTVRAKDEDAGGVVRCSYCGRTAAVPEDEKGDLSFLFREVEPAQEAPRRKRRSKLFRSKPGGPFNPFPLVFRLCYAALLVVVLVVVIRKFVLPLIRDPHELSRRFEATSNTAPANSSAPATTQGSGGGTGLLEPRNLSGLYVMSTPPGASVFTLEEAKAPVGGRVSNNPNATKFVADGRPVRVNDGTYVVEVAFAWNDPSLSDPALSNYDEYLKFRRAIEAASDTTRTELASRYFLPDEASHVFIEETLDQIYIVRQYRGVSVRQGQSPGVRALFLPRIQGKESGAFALEPLLRGYIPDRKLYAFDEKHVQNELAYYGVAGADQPYVLQALSRIGLVPYRVSDGQLRLFKIGIQDGGFATRVLSEPKT
jgi:hypothetical protein